MSHSTALCVSHAVSIKLCLGLCVTEYNRQSDAGIRGGSVSGHNFLTAVPQLCSRTGSREKQNISCAIGTLPLVNFLILFLKVSEGASHYVALVDLKRTV